ncbi:hypothetical protein SA11R_01500 [Rothia kristinae]|nr:hypothetical protein SA11R_01500 [Rothia kristinae]KTR79498.1 hypothetical protein RSA28_07915 [Rothia kristinae]
MSSSPRSSALSSHRPIPMPSTGRPRRTGSSVGVPAASATARYPADQGIQPAMPAAACRALGRSRIRLSRPNSRPENISST